MLYTTSATLLISGFMFFLTARAGALRGKHDIVPPKMVGNEDFEIAYRIQANSVEQLVIFMPIMWVGAISLGDIWGGAAGLVWIIGRLVYAKAMNSDPSKRGTGMIITTLPMAVLLIGTAVSLVLDHI